MLLMGNMKCPNFIICVLILIIYQAKGDKEDKSEEIPENLPIQSISTITTTTTTDGPMTNTTSSSEEGPPDSHEALHNRELKPKLTISSNGGRDKRSYEFLVGLVRNQSGFEMTRARKGEGNGSDYDNSDGKIDMKAAGDLMEMLVKISSHPKEWKSVHDMLVQIDNDLQNSKRILDQINMAPSNTSPTKISIPPNEKKSHPPQQHTHKLSEQPYQSISNIKTWPFDEALSQTTQHNLDISNNGVVDPTKVSYPHNFAYHRVTGKPLYQHHHMTSNSKGPTKAYIAVSVIAPKSPILERDDEINLENELRQLKPWTHQQNLRNMADIRSKWIIQSSIKDAIRDTDD